MRYKVTSLTQSCYYTPAFNAAIFDGPFRIYFSQQEEAMALKIYFGLQENLNDNYHRAKDQFKKNGKNVFIMLYPNQESFRLSFESAGEGDLILSAKLEDDELIGVQGPVQDSDHAEIYSKLNDLIRKWPSVNQSVAQRPSFSAAPELTD